MQMTIEPDLIKKRLKTPKKSYMSPTRSSAIKTSQSVVPLLEFASQSKLDLKMQKLSFELKQLLQQNQQVQKQIKTLSSLKA